MIYDVCFVAFTLSQNLILVSKNWRNPKKLFYPNGMAVGRISEKGIPYLFRARYVHALRFMPYI